jgi:hypothetical protein
MDYPLRQAQGRLSRPFAFGKGRLTTRSVAPPLRKDLGLGSHRGADGEGAGSGSLGADVTKSPN